MRWMVLGFLRAYQTYLSMDRGWLGKLVPHSSSVCRFEPSCSEYAIQAVERFGVARGLFLSARRVSRCHPWGGSGYDPVPEA